MHGRGSYWVLLLTVALLSFTLVVSAQDIESEPEIEELDEQSQISEEGNTALEAKNAESVEDTGDADVDANTDVDNAEPVEPEQVPEDAELAEPAQPDGSTELVKPEQPEPESDTEQNAVADAGQNAEETGIKNAEHNVGQDAEPEQEPKHVAEPNSDSIDYSETNREHDVAPAEQPEKQVKLIQQPNNDRNNVEQKWIRIRVLSFNTWYFGASVENGIEKLVDSIVMAAPDIVALQEMQDHGNMHGLLRRLKTITGRNWFGVDDPERSQPDIAIISPHLLINDSFIKTESGIGIDVQLIPGIPSSVVHVWSVHLDYQFYGPYDLCDPQKAPTYQYYPTRLEQMVRITDRIKRLVNTAKPKIIVGDFNEPSHLDWVEEARALHCQRMYEWGVSKNLEDEGYADAFRVAHPNPLATPGVTWSTVRKWKNADKNDFSVLEPQDRIDFIMTKGTRLRVEGAITYQGRPYAPLRVEPNYRFNEWPSDHYGVIADLQLLL